MNTEYAYVHDNEILSYSVDIHNNKLEMLTKYENKEKTAIIFTDYIAHRFEYVTYQNIINHITQIPIEDFVEKNWDLLEDGVRHAFPIFAKSCKELQDYLKKKEKKIFEISSTLGLCGFVISGDVLIDVQEAQGAEDTGTVSVKENPRKWQEQGENAKDKAAHAGGDLHGVGNGVK